MASPVYDTIGRGYLAHRRVEPAWDAEVARHLSGCRRVVNVGAGTGTYEPPGCEVVAIEPSAVMIGQRPATAAPAVRASSAALPLPDGSADAVLAVNTVHHWDDWVGGLAELCRVAPKRVVLAIDFHQHARFWLLSEYLPEVRAHTLACRPGADAIADAIGATVQVLEVPRAMQDRVLGGVLVPARGLPGPDRTRQLLGTRAGRPGGRGSWRRGLGGGPGQPSLA